MYLNEAIYRRLVIGADLQFWRADQFGETPLFAPNLMSLLLGQAFEVVLGDGDDGSGLVLVDLDGLTCCLKSRLKYLEGVRRQ
jgi:hypothetical protein